MKLNGVNPKVKFNLCEKSGKLTLTNIEAG
jgi:hypothetical protein